MCIKISSEGFQVVSNKYDTYNSESVFDENFEIYETPYALLNVISKKYTKSFGDELSKALEKLV